MNLKKSLLGSLSFDNMYKRVCGSFDQVLDHRSSNCTYRLTDILKSAFAIFSLKEPSLLSFQNNSRDFAGNMSDIYKVNAVPKDSSFRETLDKVEPSAIKKIFKNIFTYLKRNKVFSNYRYLGNYLIVSVDGVEHFRSKKIHCDHCLETRHANGELSYHHAMLSAVIVHPDCAEVFPVGCEEIMKQDGSTKNDCEINASKRLLTSMIRDLENEKLLFVEDALYSVQPHITQLESANYSYILGIKPDRHKTLFKQMQGRIDRGQIDQYSIDKNGETHQYLWMNNVPLNAQKGASRVNLLHFEIIVNGKCIKRFTWITDIKIRKNNLEQIMKAGRARWKVENETFNTLKNQGYNMEHNYGHGEKNLTTILTLIMFIAFLVDQVQQFGCNLFSKLLSKTKTRKKLWEYQRSCFLILPFKSMFNLHLKIASLFQVQLE